MSLCCVFINLIDIYRDPFYFHWGRVPSITQLKVLLLTVLGNYLMGCLGTIKIELESVLCKANTLPSPVTSQSFWHESYLFCFGPYLTMLSAYSCLCIKVSFLLGIGGTTYFASDITIVYCLQGKYPSRCTIFLVAQNSRYLKKYIVRLMPLAVLMYLD